MEKNTSEFIDRITMYYGYNSTDARAILKQYGAKFILSPEVIKALEASGKTKPLYDIIYHHPVRFFVTALPNRFTKEDVRKALEKCQILPVGRDGMNTFAVLKGMKATYSSKLYRVRKNRKRARFDAICKFLNEILIEEHIA